MSLPDTYAAGSDAPASPLRPPQRRYSLACRPIERDGLTVSPGHGGRYSATPEAPCPRCGRPMALTGAMTATSIGGKV